jgi:hypothetical protein
LLCSYGTCARMHFQPARIPQPAQLSLAFDQDQEIINLC